MYERVRPTTKMVQVKTFSKSATYRKSPCEIDRRIVNVHHFHFDNLRCHFYSQLDISIVYCDR